MSQLEIQRMYDRIIAEKQAGTYVEPEQPAPDLFSEPEQVEPEQADKPRRGRPPKAREDQPEAQPEQAAE